MTKLTLFCLALFLAFALFSFSVYGSASFEVTSFSCSPSEVVINSVFSCTASVQNKGDVSGSVSTATLYSDESSWLENSNYPQASGSSVGVGQSVSITFTGLKAVKSGNNGFSKIMLDNVEDKYVVNQNKKVNVINVAVTVTNSASSAVMGASITSTAEINAGGNIDVDLTFVSNSGGCSIGSQTNPKSFAGLTDGSKQSWAWTVTQGTSGNCQFTISASATSSGGDASKIDSTSSTITCTDCPVSTSTSSSSGGGSGGGGGAGSKVYVLGELISPQAVELSKSEQAEFNISGVKHTLTLKNNTQTTATVIIESKKQTFTISVGDEINVDLDSDNLAEISVKLQTINVMTNKVTFVMAKLSSKVAPTKSEEQKAEDEAKKSLEKEKPVERSWLLWWAIAFFAIVAVISLAYYLKLKNKRIWGYG